MCNIDKAYLYNLIEKVENLIDKKIRVGLYLPQEFTENKLGDLLNFFEYDVVATKQQPESILKPDLSYLQRSNLLHLIKPLVSEILIKINVIIRSDNLSQLALRKVKPWTKYIQGYHTDSKILMDAIPDLSLLIDQTAGWQWHYAPPTHPWSL